MLSDYNDCEPIGYGGFGNVYKCKNKDNQIRAIKIFKREYLADELLKRRFQREVRSLSKLTHENIIPILEYDTETEFYFVMPLASSDLEKYINTHTVTNLTIYDQILRAIKHSHDNGIIHRDLKPSNVLLFKEYDCVVMLTDFGLAKFIDRDTEPLTRTGEFWGTEYYASPEQKDQTRDVGKTSDIYSLGKILYKILTGQLPYPDLDYSLIPSDYKYIIKKACANDPSDRFQSIDELIEAINIVKFYDLKDPISSINTEIEKILEHEDFSIENTANLAKMLFQNRDNNMVLSQIFPTLDKRILISLIENHFSLFMPVLKDYDESVSLVGLPFSYCDVVARFYLRIFDSNRFEIQSIIIRRLPHLGYLHNRYYVGQVLGQIVNNSDEISILMELKDLFEKYPSIAEWCNDYVDSNKLKTL